VPNDKDRPARPEESGSRNPPARQEGPQPNPAIPTMSVEIAQSSFSGPLPPPDILRGYDQIVPGAAARILKMAEEQAQHRQNLERIVIEGGSKRANMGLWLGFILSMVVLALSAALIFNGYEIAGTVIGSIDLVSLVTVFVVGRIDQRRERVDKATEGQVG
jgi:uncharacterized membrane protein